MKSNRNPPKGESHEKDATLKGQHLTAQCATIDEREAHIHDIQVRNTTVSGTNAGQGSKVTIGSGA